MNLIGSFKWKANCSLNSLKTKFSAKFERCLFFRLQKLIIVSLQKWFRSFGLSRVPRLYQEKPGLVLEHAIQQFRVSVECKQTAFEIFFLRYKSPEFIKWESFLRMAWIRINQIGGSL